MNKTFRFSTVFLFFALVAMSLTSATCNPDIDPSLGPDEMKANSNVEGSFFANDGLLKSSSTYLVTAAMDYPPIGGVIKITLNIPKKTSVPYDIIVGTDDVGLIEYCLEESPSVCTIFNAKKSVGSGNPVGSGKITITSLSPYLEGTFSGTLPQVGGAQSRVISGGEFKVRF